MNIIKNILIILMTLFLTISMLIFSFRIVCFYDTNFLPNLYEKYNVYQNLEINISKDDVLKISTLMMDYLNNKEDNFSYICNINGVKKDFVSERTKIHFVDVKNLMNKFRVLSYISLILAFILFSLVKNYLTFKKYIISLAIVGIIYFVLALAVVMNFDNFFVTFHKTFFNNDFWLLDPNEDYIICLLPEELFKDIALKILACFTLIMTVITIFLKILFRPVAK